MTSTNALHQRRHLLPSNYAKKILIDFCTQWLKENSAYSVATDGEPSAEPNQRDDEGRTIVREGDYPFVVRDSFGSNDESDLTTGIVVQRQPFGWANRSIGQKLHFVRQLEPDGAISQGQEYTDTIEMPMVCWCCAKEGLEADDIACMLTFALHAVRSILPGEYEGLRDILGVRCGEETILRRPTTKQELVGVPVYVTLELQYFWKIFDLRGLTMKGAIIEMKGDSSEKLSITVKRS